MTGAERSKDLYEQIPAYPKPPLMPLPDLDDWDVWEDMGFKSNWLSRTVLKATMLVTGFRTFQRQLPDNVEELLRTVDLRQGGLFSPTICATLALEDDPRELSPIERAATLILAARNFYSDLMSGQLEPDRHRDQVLEMGQYPNLFSTSLILKGKTPRIFKSTDVSRITVVIDRQLYSLEVGDLDKVTVGQVTEALEQLVHRARQSPAPADAPAPGLLTCATTATQRRIFGELQKNATNVESLSTLQHSFTTLCLDLDKHPENCAEAALIAHSGNPSNRWYHSSMQLVVFGNAKAAVVCNFGAYLDGNVMMRAGSEMYRRAVAWELGNGAGGERDGLAPARELRWQIRPEMVRQAQKDLQSVLDDQPATFELEGFGQDFFLAHDLSPIPAFILALQMTVRRLMDKKINIDQFLTMSKFRCMDVVTGMVSTPEVLRFVDYMEGDDVRRDRDRDRALALVHEAIDSQVREMRKVRQHLPPGVILNLFIGSRQGIRRTFTLLGMGLATVLLRVLGAFKPVRRREILVSHPDIFPEVPVIGRPGARLPYVRYFGFHYQMITDKTVVTMMPGVTWKVPNAEFIAELRANLGRLRQVIVGEG